MVGLSGAAGALGPLLGGALSTPPAGAGCSWSTSRSRRRWPRCSSPGTRNARAGFRSGRFDVPGAVLAAIGLGGITYALTHGADDPGQTVAAAVVGLAAVLAFWQVERRSRHPMLPFAVFGSRPFTAANLAGFLLYGALAALMFVLPIQLQITTGYSALAPGSRSAADCAHPGAVGPRWDPRRHARPARPVDRRDRSSALLLCCWRPGSARDASYADRRAPGRRAPRDRDPAGHAGPHGIVLSAVARRARGHRQRVSNGVARAAGLLVVAALPLLARLPRYAAGDPTALDQGFDRSMLIGAGLCALGGIVAWFGVVGTGPTTPRRTGALVSARTPR